MTKKILAAGTSSNWTSIAGALEGLLRFFGTPLGRETVMGLSGHAFRLAIWTSDEGIADGESAVCFDHQRALPLYESLGYAMQRIGARQDDPAYTRTREDAIRAIRRSIDRGRPVAAYGLQVPDFGIVKGYDDRAGLLYVSTTVSPQYGEALPLTQWPAPGHRQALEVILPGGRRPVDRRLAERAALTFALRYAEEGDSGGPPNTEHGLKAYRRWLEAYASPGRLAPFGNARCIQTVQAARHDAAVFLRSLAPAYPSGPRAAFEEAAAAYEQEALAFSRLATLFPFPNGGDTLSAGTLAIGAASLRQAFEREREALGALAGALALI